MSDCHFAVHTVTRDKYTVAGTDPEVRTRLPASAHNPPVSGPFKEGLLVFAIGLCKKVVVQVMGPFLSVIIDEVYLLLKELLPFVHLP